MRRRSCAGRNRRGGGNHRCDPLGARSHRATRGPAKRTQRPTPSVARSAQTPIASNWWLIAQSDLLYLCLDVLATPTKAARTVCNMYGVTRLRRAEARHSQEIPGRLYARRQCETAESLWRRSAGFFAPQSRRENRRWLCPHDPNGIRARLQRPDRLAVCRPPISASSQYRTLAPERTGPAFLRKRRTTWQRIRGNHDRIKP